MRTQSCDLIMTLESIRQTDPLWGKEDWNCLNRGVQLTFIVEKPSKVNPLPLGLKRLTRHPNFKLRYLDFTPQNPIVIEDDRKVWICIASSENTNFLESPHLVSTNPHLIALAKDYFRRVYKDSTPVGNIEKI